MPTYQYRCTSCDHRFDAVQSFSDAALTTCPACTGALRKVYSSVGIVFKGSGFYRTDSRSGNGSGADSTSGSEKNGAAAKKDTAGSTAGKDSGSGSSSSSTSGSSSAGSKSSGSATAAPAAAAS